MRYDSEIFSTISPVLAEWRRLGWIIPVCPEVAGGLPVPRPPAEIQGGDGKDVVDGTGQMIDINGKDVTHAFLTGAREALRLAEENGVEFAILKARSPSCGSKMTYDGSFSGKLKTGQGVTAALIESIGIQVFDEDEIDQAASLIGR